MKRLSGREQRYQSWLNHTISRAIVNKAKSSKAVIAIEDLTGIRERTNQQPRNKIERRRSNCGWEGNADLNGAINIAIIGAFVSKPRGSGLSCSLSKNVSGLPQDSVLLCAVGESPVTSARG